jgi:polyadenylate-binding protein
VVLTTKVGSSGKEAEVSTKGYGFVQFETPEGAKAAVEAVANKTDTILDSPEIEVEHFVPKDQRTTPVNYTNIYIRGFPDDWLSENLKQYFERFGEVLSCKVATSNKGETLKFGFVNFKE